MNDYGDVLWFYDDNAPTRTQPSKSVDEWKEDPTVVSVTEEGLPPGWVKIIQNSPKGKRVFFKSPTKARIK